MIRTYANRSDRFVLMGETVDDLPAAVWVDLLRPTEDEVATVERTFDVDVPTLDEMSEIELSSRLYVEHGAQFMTAMMLSHTDGDNIVLSPVSFVRIGDRLITVRYEAPRAIDAFVTRCHKSGTYTADNLLIGLLEGLIERSADVLERAGHELDHVSRAIFSLDTPQPKSASSAKPKGGQRDFQSVLEQIGRKGDLLSKVYESLVSLQRLIAYAAGMAQGKPNGADIANSFGALGRDVQSLVDHTTFLNQKITFLLDATLGMINIQQTTIIKLFSVAAVVFLPPTLIASIYGMNFDFMPELAWPYGYPAALILMVVSAVVPYQFFKWQRWL